MTEPTPEELTAERLGGPIRSGTGLLPGWYGPKEGPGRWFPLFAHGQPLGYVWTNDDDGLGFWPTTDAGRVRTPEFVVAFRGAKMAKAPATEVFNHWAAMASLGLSAGPVEAGDLTTLE